MIWVLVQAVAVTIVVTKGDIFKWLRGGKGTGWNNFASCPLCVGVWVGVAHATAEVSAWGWMRALETLGVGCVTGVIALATWSVVDALGALVQALDALRDASKPVLAPRAPQK